MKSNLCKHRCLNSNATAFVARHSASRSHRSTCVYLPTSYRRIYGYKVR